jgi:hypothetical protein
MTAPQPTLVKDTKAGIIAPNGDVLRYAPGFDQTPGAVPLDLPKYLPLGNQLAVNYRQFADWLCAATQFGNRVPYAELEGQERWQCVAHAAWEWLALMTEKAILEATEANPGKPVQNKLIEALILQMEAVWIRSLRIATECGAGHVYLYPAKGRTPVHFFRHNWNERCTYKGVENPDFLSFIIFQPMIEEMEWVPLPKA